VLLVAVAQLFGALMNLAARLLELRSQMHPFQILFVRMAMTTIFSCLYMWWKKVPDFPLGPKGMRGVLVLRGVSGFVSVLFRFAEKKKKPAEADYNSEPESLAFWTGS